MRNDTDTDLALQALRYAAGELTPAEVEVFESRLAVDQAAREALAEAVRLSAAASGAPDPTPDPLTRAAVADRLRPTWLTRLFPRRPYRGHPLAWAGVGGSVTAAVVYFAATPPADPSPAPVAHTPAVVAPPASAPESRMATTEPTFKGADPLSNPKLNPMGLNDHSPMTQLLPKLPTDPAPPSVGAPAPAPTSSRAAAPPEPDAKKG